MRSSQIILLVPMICLFAIVVSLAEQDAMERTRQVQAISSSDQAIAKAIDYAGFTKTDSFLITAQIHAQQVTIDNDQTPFLADRINNKPIWKVAIENAKVTCCRKKATRDFTFFIDPIDGHLLKLVSVVDDFVDGKDSILAAADVEKKYVSSGIKYLRTYERPEVSFYDAIQSCPINYLTAKKLVGVCVIESYEKFSDTCGVWVFDLTSIDPPLEPIGYSGANIPVEKRNFIRCVINAENGRLRYCTNRLP
jgi:hypothetical protein